jgi:hypothetical protein
MALTAFQRELCRLLAAQRLASGESYVARGAALNELLRAPRVSRDVDLFHDTVEALARTFEADGRELERDGYGLRVVRERPSFVEAEVRRGKDLVLLQWVQDSAYRFFPLVREEPFGLTLHPLDLATNKVLALVGRVEVRDWIDTLTSCERIQHLGYLAWAACGKDPGFSPTSLLAHAARTTRYSADEVAALEFDGPPPDAGELSRAGTGCSRRRTELSPGCPPKRLVVASSARTARSTTPPRTRWPRIWSTAACVSTPAASGARCRA